MMKSEFRRFLFQYVLAGFIGTAVIVFAAPFVDRASLPPVFGEMDRRLQVIPGVPKASASLRRWLGLDLRRLIFRPAQRPVPPPAPAPRPLPATPPQPPKPKPKPAARVQKRGYWAVVRHTRTPLYTEKGKFVSRLSPGVLADVLEIRKTQSGDLALCRIPGERSISGTVLIPVNDLEIQGGPLESADREEVDLRVDRARLMIELQELKQQASKTLRADNPHAGAYAAAQTAHGDYWKKVREIRTRHDNATGETRASLADQLRGMRGEDVQLGQALETARKKYDAWNAAHPPAQAGTPEIRRMEASLADINTQLKRIKEERLARELEED